MFQSAKPTVSGDYSHYYSGDPALDTDSADFDHDRWKETGEDKYLPRRNGTTPVEFILRHLSSREYRFLQDVAKREGDFTMAWYAVALALSDVVPLVDAKGKAEDLRFTVDGKLSRVCDEQMDLLNKFEEGALFYELAARVMGETYGNPT